MSESFAEYERRRSELSLARQLHDAFVSLLPSLARAPDGEQRLYEATERVLSEFTAANGTGDAPP